MMLGFVAGVSLEVCVVARAIIDLHFSNITRLSDLIFSNFV